MSLQQWADSGWLRPHTTNHAEIANLLAIVDRDLSDAAKGISPDWRFGIAYNAALKLCTILLYSEGYRPERTLQHYRTIQSMPLILGDEHKSDAEYLEACRKKRNIAEYEYVGGITEKEAEELIEFVKTLRNRVLEWLKNYHPQLLTP
jgi:hypothetical protein